MAFIGEVALAGFLIFLEESRCAWGDRPRVGTVLGKNRINIANFSLGRSEGPAKPGEALEAVAVVSTDELVPESVLAGALRENPARWNSLARWKYWG